MGLGHHREASLNHGAQIDKQDEDGATPLCVAAYNDKVAAARLLRSRLPAGAINIKHEDVERTALHWAAEQGHPLLGLFPLRY